MTKLLKMLKTYTPFDDVEKEHVANTLHLLKTEKEPHSRTTEIGHITGSALLFSNDFKKILLTHHKKLNKWVQFGGHADGDENTLRVAVKELTEESGITDFELFENKIFDVDIQEIPAYKNIPAHLHYDIRFAFTTCENNFIVNEESIALKWFTFEQFKELQSRVKDPGLLRVIKKWGELLGTKLLSEKEYKQGARIIKGGGVVAFRTETVFGLGADATNCEAVKKIFVAKNRPQNNPLIVHFHSIKHLQEYLIIPPEILPLFRIKAPLTIVIQNTPTDTTKPLSPIVCAGQKTVACRIPTCGFTRKFIRACGTPISAPSANTSTRPSPTRWQDVFSDLDGRIDAIIKGKPTKFGIESTVVLYTDGKLEVLRHGAVSVKKLARLTKLVVTNVADSEKLKKSPGTMHKHYTPSVPVVLFKKPEEIPALIKDKAAVILFKTNKEHYKGLRAINLGKTCACVQTNFFKALRDAEKMLLEKPNPVILVEQMPSTQEFAGINDRICKACGK
ncbi:MAG: L-threonylcarbamoyladenylate synthase [Firmicutes bacterium]|nr:L-threonylcarbamoyladenylate synthase [Bacillota bacterium]